MSRKLIKDSSIYGLGQVLSRSFGFLLIPIYTRYLEVDEYGSLALLNMLLQVISFVCLMGIGQAAMRFYYDTNADDRHRQEVYGTATVLLLVLPIVALVVLGPVLWLLGREFLSAIPFYPYIFIVLLIGLFTPLDKLMSGLLRIQRRAMLYVTFNAAFLLFQMLTILVGVVWLGYGLIGQLWAQLVANAVASVAAFIILRRFSRPVLVRPLAARMLRYGIPLIPFFILFWLSNAAGRFVLEGFGTLTQVGLYALAAQFAGLLLLVSTAADNALMPHFLERAGQPGTEDELGVLITRYLAVIGMISLGVVAFSGPVIEFVSTATYHEAARYVAPLVLANWLSAASRPVIWGFNHTGRSATLSLIQGGSVVLLVGLLVLCLGPLDLGINGVAAATIGANLAFLSVGWWVAGHGFRPRIPWRRFVPITLLLFASGFALAAMGGAGEFTVAEVLIKLLILLLVTAGVAWLAGIRRLGTLFRAGD